MERITSIYQTAADEHRELTAQEQEDIKMLQDQMRDDAISALSETEEEAAVIRERMNSYQGRLSAEMASEFITKANEARDGEIQAAQEKYDELVKQAARMQAAGDITEDEYKRMTEEAEKTREITVEKAKEACEGIKDEIVNANPNIEREVSIQTGKIKDGWDKLGDYATNGWNYITSLFNSALSKANSIKSGAGVRLGGRDGSHYNGLDYVPFDGYNARLHKGERVLTAEENRAYNAGFNASGNYSGGVTITGNTFNVRDDQDIEKIAQALYELKLKEQRGIGMI